MHKINFSIWDSSQQEFIKGYQSATELCCIGNNYFDKTKMSLSFAKGPDDYLQIVLDNKAVIKRLIKSTFMEHLTEAQQKELWECLLISEAEVREHMPGIVEKAFAKEMSKEQKKLKR